MRIFRPIKSDYFFQGFGQNLACTRLNDAGKPIIPYQVVRGVYGGVCPQKTTKLYPLLGLKGHNGEDWGLYRGEPIHFPVLVKGIAYTEVDRQGGKGVDVFFVDRATKKRYKLRFWHLKDFNVYDGQEVSAGQIIGYGNSTGISSGNHLHWSLKEVDENRNTLHKWKGYYGAIDFRPYFENEFILVVLNLKQQLSILKKVANILQKLISIWQKKN